MTEKWNYKESECKLEEVGSGIYRLYVDGEDIIGDPYSCKKNQAINKIEKHIDTAKLSEKLETILGRSEHFKNTKRGWEVNEKLAKEYDGSARNQAGVRYRYRTDKGKIKESMFAKAPYNGGTDMWLQGNNFDSIAEFREYIGSSYGINI